MQSQAITQSEVQTKLNNLMNKYVGTTWNGNYYGIQCKGFANLIFYELFGVVHIGPYEESGKYYIASPSGATETGRLDFSQMSESKAKDLLLKGKPGDFIQVRRRNKSYGHSMILVSCDNNGITVFDCNSDGKCGVKKYNVSYSTFYSQNSAMSLYHAKNYEITPVCNCSASYAGTYTTYDVQTSLNIRSESSHSTSGSIVGSIPSGAKFNVTKANGSIAHVNYNGQTGIVSMAYIQKAEWYNGLNPENLGDEFDALILNKNCWKPLMIENSISENSDVVLGTENSSNMSREVWRFKRNSDGSYRIMPLHNLSLSLDTDVDSKRVLIWGNHDGANQKWFIYSYGARFIFRPACSDTMVLDLNENNTNDGTPIKLYEKNGSEAQIFDIWKFSSPGSAKLTATAGTASTDTKFSWTKTNDTETYYLKIWKNKAWEGESYKEIKTTDTNVNVILPEGTYQAYIDSCNHYSYTCSNVITVNVGPCQHKFSDWTVTKNDTCTEDGSKARKCNLCNKSETETITKTGHNYVNTVVKPTCTEQGYTLHKCSNCQNEYKDTNVNAAGHKFSDWTVTKEATCIEEGVKSRKCNLCNKSETETITKTGHNYVNTVVKPTCTEQGYTLHKCSNCQNEYKDTNVNAAGHKFSDWTVTKEATCIEEGVKSRKCNLCNKSETATIAKTGINITFDSNGGNVSTTSKIVMYNQTYGDLPIPTRAGYEFTGWYTDKNNGTKINADTKVTVTANQALYAQWKIIAIKGDANNDSTVNVSDAVMLQKWLLGSGTLTNWKNADLCEDGKIDVFDLVTMRQLLIQNK
ncbi:MAG: InlB B-repeat-containing protein [Ruminococcus sp.]|nr:InlB B-repeat-containing protein [Ruminococcus sp.]